MSAFGGYGTALERLSGSEGNPISTDFKIFLAGLLYIPALALGIILVIDGNSFRLLGKSILWLVIIAFSVFTFWLRHRLRQRQAAAIENANAVAGTTGLGDGHTIHATRGVQQTQTTISALDATKRCPYCAEEILAAAIKCKHCGSSVRSLSLSDDVFRPGQSARPAQAIRLPFKIMLWIIVILVGWTWYLSITHPLPTPTIVAASPDPPAGSATETASDPQPEKSKGTSRATKINQAAPETRHPVYRTTAAALFQEYEANEVATDQKIGGALVEITGTIKTIDKDIFNEPEIKLEVGDEFDSIALTLDKSELSAAARLYKGQFVTIRCEKMSRVITLPVGQHCRLAE